MQNLQPFNYMLQRQDCIRYFKLDDNTIVCMRPYTLADVVPLFHAYNRNMQYIGKFILGGNYNFSLTQSKELVNKSIEAWDNYQMYNFLVVDVSNNQILGHADITEINYAHRFCHIGCWVARYKNGTQYKIGVKVTDICVAYMAYLAIDKMGINRIEMAVDIDNTLSLRGCLSRSPAKNEGILRKRLNISGEAKDAYMLAIMPQDLDFFEQALKKYYYDK